MVNQKLKMVTVDNRGFTLVEILVALFILVIGIIGTLQLFNYCAYLAEMSGNTNYVIDQAQSKIDEMRSTAFSNIAVNYAAGGTPGNTFNVTNPAGKGIIIIDSSTADLLTVEINVSWKNERNDRIIGEDMDLDGVLDAGEDINGNGKLDSTVKLITLIARK